jgi:hypothetical protein
MIPGVNIFAAIYSAVVLKHVSDSRKDTDVDYLAKKRNLTEEQKNNSTLINVLKIVDNIKSDVKPNIHPNSKIPYTYKEHFIRTGGMIGEARKHPNADAGDLLKDRLMQLIQNEKDEATVSAYKDMLGQITDQALLPEGSFIERAEALISVRQSKKNIETEWKNLVADLKPLDQKYDIPPTPGWGKGDAFSINKIQLEKDVKELLEKNDVDFYNSKEKAKEISDRIQTGQYTVNNFNSDYAIEKRREPERAKAQANLKDQYINLDKEINGFKKILDYPIFVLGIAEEDIIRIRQSCEEISKEIAALPPGEKEKLSPDEIKSNREALKKIIESDKMKKIREFVGVCLDNKNKMLSKEKNKLEDLREKLELHLITQQSSTIQGVLSLRISELRNASNKLLENLNVELEKFKNDEWLGRFDKSLALIGKFDEQAAINKQFIRERDLYKKINNFQTNITIALGLAKLELYDENDQIGPTTRQKVLDNGESLTKESQEVINIDRWPEHSWEDKLTQLLGKIDSFLVKDLSDLKQVQKHLVINQEISKLVAKDFLNGEPFEYPISSIIKERIGTFPRSWEYYYMELNRIALEAGAFFDEKSRDLFLKGTTIDTSPLSPGPDRRAYAYKYANAPVRNIAFEHLAYQKHEDYFVSALQNALLKKVKQELGYQLQESTIKAAVDNYFKERHVYRTVDSIANEIVRNLKREYAHAFEVARAYRYA